MKSLVVFLLLASLTMVGCSGKFWGGSAVGAVGAGAGYEYNMNQQMKKIDDDLKAGKITQEEYNIRKDQIQRDSLLK